MSKRPLKGDCHAEREIFVISSKNKSDRGLATDEGVSNTGTALQPFSVMDLRPDLKTNVLDNQNSMIYKF
jgi:hypothetical protein